MFGLDEPSERERAAREGLQRLASGRVATPAQLMLQQQKNDTLKNLQSLASRGTAQQQAGNVRAAMQAAPGIQQQQAGQLAALRASEMQQAQSALSQLEQQQGSQDRKYMQGLIGAGVSGAAGAGAMAMTQSPDAKKPLETLNEDFTGSPEKAAPTPQEYAAKMMLPDGSMNAPPAVPAAPAALPVAGAVAPVAVSQATPSVLGPVATPAARSTGGLGTPAARSTGGLGTPATDFDDGLRTPYRIRGLRSLMGGN
jgi:hypothetical protein